MLILAAAELQIQLNIRIHYLWISGLFLLVDCQKVWLFGDRAKDMYDQLRGCVIL